jgi:hypothetical protein
MVVAFAGILASHQTNASKTKDEGDHDQHYHTPPSS